MTGFINVNKAQGVSSAAEVARVKKLTGVPCGHMGTLDPMACGVLPVAVGNASRLFEYFLQKRKRYIAEFTFGDEYDTLDTTGTVTAAGGRIPSQKEIEAVLSQLTGEIEQVPPIYSAKSVSGERAYKIARRGGTVQLSARRVSVGEFKCLGSSGAGAFRFEIECGSGTYIRSLARDIGKLLGTYAAMSALTRTVSGPFIIKDSVETQHLNADNIFQYLITADSVLPYPEIRLTAAEQRRYTNGVAIRYGVADGQYKVYLADGVFYGVGESKGSVLKSRLKLC